MIKFYLDYGEWKTLIDGATGFPQNEDEVYSLIRQLACNKDVVIILTAANKPQTVLKYDINSEEFSEFPLES